MTALCSFRVHLQKGNVNVSANFSLIFMSNPNEQFIRIPTNTSGNDISFAVALM